MKISLHFRSLCLAVGLASALASPGCATFDSDLTAFRSAIDVADMIIDAIDDFTTSYFASHPDPAKQAAIKTAEAQARAAAAAALSIANGAGDASNGNVAQAFADFENAYSSLLALAQSLGVKAAAPGAKVGVSASPGVLVVPAPGDLRPAMVKEVARPAVSLKSPGAISTLRWPGDGPEYADNSRDLFLSEASFSDGVPLMLVRYDWNGAPSACTDGMRNAVAVLPGAVCMRDDAKWEDVYRWMRHQGLSGRETGGGPLVDSIADLSARWTDPMLMKGMFGSAETLAPTTLASCDDHCGVGRSLAPPSGCLCQTGAGRAAHWVPLREMPGAGMVAAR